VSVPELLMLYFVRQQELLREAELERLGAQLPSSPRRSLRHVLASGLHAVATWMDPIGHTERVHAHVRSS
jgi:hypothetical protein